MANGNQRTVNRAESNFARIQARQLRESRAAEIQRQASTARDQINAARSQLESRQAQVAAQRQQLQMQSSVRQISGAGQLAQRQQISQALSSQELQLSQGFQQITQAERVLSQQVADATKQLEQIGVTEVSRIQTPGQSVPRGAIGNLPGGGFIVSAEEALQQSLPGGDFTIDVAGQSSPEGARFVPVITGTDFAPTGIGQPSQITVPTREEFTFFVPGSQFDPNIGGAIRVGARRAVDFISTRVRDPIELAAQRIGIPTLESRATILGSERLAAVRARAQEIAEIPIADPGRLAQEAFFAPAFVAESAITKIARPVTTLGPRQQTQVLEAVTIRNIPGTQGKQFRVSLRGSAITPGRVRQTQSTLDRLLGANTFDVGTLDLRGAIAEFTIDSKGNILKGGIAIRKIGGQFGGVSAGRSGPIDVFTTLPGSGARTVGQVGEAALTPTEQFLARQLPGRFPSDTQVIRTQLGLQRQIRLAPSSRTAFIPAAGRRTIETQGLVFSRPVPGTQGRLLQTTGVSTDVTFPILRLDPARRVVKSQGRIFIEETTQEVSGSVGTRLVRAPKNVVKKVQELQTVVQDVVAKQAPSGGRIRPTPSVQPGTTAVQQTKRIATGGVTLASLSSVLASQTPLQKAAETGLISQSQRSILASRSSQVLKSLGAVREKQIAQFGFGQPQAQTPKQNQLAVQRQILTAFVASRITQAPPETPLTVTTGTPPTRTPGTPPPEVVPRGLVGGKLPTRDVTILRSALSKIKGKGVDVVTGFGGKKKVVGKNLPKNKALKRGLDFVSDNIEASFRLVETGKKATGKDIRFPTVSGQFRLSKRNPLVLVEKRKFRLDTPRERAQLKARRRK